MQEQDNYNENEQPYQMPTTDLSDVGGDNPVVHSSSASDIITAVGGVDPSRFWMIAMIILSVGLGLTLFFGGGYLVKQLDNKETKILALEKKLEDCPEETLAKMKKQQLEFQDLKRVVKGDSIRIDSVILSKKTKIDKMKKIEEKL